MLVVSSRLISSYLGRMRRTLSSWTRTSSKECLLTRNVSPINSFRLLIYLCDLMEKLKRTALRLVSKGTQKKGFCTRRTSGMGSEMFM